MLENYSYIKAEASKLSPLEKIELIEDLYYSLESNVTREEIDFLWKKEVEKRYHLLEDESTQTIEIKEVFEKIQRL